MLCGALRCNGMWRGGGQKSVVEGCVNNKRYGWWVCFWVTYFVMSCLHVNANVLWS